MKITAKRKPVPRDMDTGSRERKWEGGGRGTCPQKGPPLPHAARGPYTLVACPLVHTWTQRGALTQSPWPRTCPRGGYAIQAYMGTLPSPHPPSDQPWPWPSPLPARPDPIVPIFTCSPCTRAAAVTCTAGDCFSSPAVSPRGKLLPLGKPRGEGGVGGGAGGAPGFLGGSPFPASEPRMERPEGQAGPSRVRRDRT